MTWHTYYEKKNQSQIIRNRQIFNNLFLKYDIRISVLN